MTTNLVVTWDDDHTMSLDIEVSSVQEVQPFFRLAAAARAQALLIRPDEDEPVEGHLIRLWPPESGTLEDVIGFQLAVLALVRGNSYGGIADGLVHGAATAASSVYHG